MGFMLNKFDSQVSVKIFSDFEVLDFLTIALEVLRLLGSQFQNDTDIKEENTL